MELSTSTKWQSSKTRVFWGEIAATDHLVQIYENDEDFLDLLESFVCDGINANDCVIIIATSSHLSCLETRLMLKGLDVKSLCKDHQYIPLNAQETLSKFMVNGQPDEILFNATVSDIIKIADNKNRQVRAFGEMVALLWAQGFSGATMELEILWNKFCASEAFCLLCAYPKSGFTQDINASISSICCSHAKMISGLDKSKREIFYQALS